ncbi:hypothetical protein [Azospirillum agricola]|uniref:hypothetical protein n=1 Tax=Azospirillum agricola TaxID=1720247 RepID=UPI000A0F35AB|nr:hypothetical protein [Azospirillum agricola]SMH43744.1 hypothetical protein SAMN02982994_1971 [Azospirillum lipoferum]
MTAPSCCLARIPANGKFWLKNAALENAPSSGFRMADIRIEDGRIRAVIPAGESPCCAPGLDLDGGAVRALAPDGHVGAGQPADLSVTLCGGKVVEMHAGHIAGLPGAL